MRIELICDGCWRREVMGVGRVVDWDGLLHCSHCGDRRALVGVCGEMEARPMRMEPEGAVSAESVELSAALGGRTEATTVRLRPVGQPGMGADQTLASVLNDALSWV
jgi:hypothetical protein